MNMAELLFTGFLLPLSVSVVGAGVTVYFSVISERKRMVNEIRRKVYMSTLRVLSKILENPLIIFDDTFFRTLKDSKLEIEVYAESKIVDLFNLLYQDIDERMQRYRDEFKSEEAVEAFSSVKGMYTEEDIEDMEFNFQIWQMPDTNEVRNLTEKLKEEITICLREG